MFAINKRKNIRSTAEPDQKEGSIVSSSIRTAQVEYQIEPVKEDDGGIVG